MFIIFLFFYVIALLIIFSVDSFDEEDSISLRQGIRDSWAKRKSQIEHEYTGTGWVLSVLPEICVNFLSELTGEHRLMIERVVERLHVPPCPNDQVSGQDTTNIIDIFWQEFKHW